MPLREPIIPALLADPDVEEDVSFTFTVEHINSIFVVCSSTILLLH